MLQRRRERRGLKIKLESAFFWALYDNAGGLRFPHKPSRSARGDIGDAKPLIRYLERKMLVCMRDVFQLMNGVRWPDMYESK